MDKLFYRIITFFFLPMCLIALVLSLYGFHGPIQFDNTYYNFMQRVAIQARDWKIEIPNIPMIPYFKEDWGIWVVLNLLIRFFNGFSSIVNVIILILNKIIEVFTILASIIKLLFEYWTNNIPSSSGALSWWSSNPSNI